MKQEGESLLQERHDMVQQLAASQEVVSDLREEVNSLRSELAENQTSSGYNVCVCVCVCVCICMCVQ